MNNTHFRHLIVDLGFPLRYGDDIPDDIDDVKCENSEELQRIAKEFGSEYVKIQNVGVSQNWSMVSRILSVGADDVLIGCEPDEIPQESGWVLAMSEVLEDSRIGLTSLLSEGQDIWLAQDMDNHVDEKINGHNCSVIHGVLAMGVIGFSGSCLRKITEVPVPSGMSIYGGIEHASYYPLKELGYSWCFLKDFHIKHIEPSGLYRSWKTDIISGNYSGVKQIHFEQWLQLKRESTR